MLVGRALQDCCCCAWCILYDSTASAASAMRACSPTHILILDDVVTCANGCTCVCHGLGSFLVRCLVLVLVKLGSSLPSLHVMLVLVCSDACHSISLSSVGYHICPGHSCPPPIAGSQAGEVIPLLLSTLRCMCMYQCVGCRSWQLRVQGSSVMLFQNPVVTSAQYYSGLVSMLLFRACSGYIVSPHCRLSIRVTQHIGLF